MTEKQSPSIKLFIKNHIDSTISLDQDLPFTTTIIQIPKDTLITPLDRIEKKAYFLIDGVVKISMYNNGHESILEFFLPNSFFSSYTSFITQQPSEVEVVALTDCNVEVINYEDLQNAYTHSALANKLGRKVIEQYYIQKTRREKDFLTKSAATRYYELVENRPEITQLVPLKMIAKYLGIQSESLSRIRNEH